MHKVLSPQVNWYFRIHQIFSVLLCVHCVFCCSKLVSAYSCFVWSDFPLETCLLDALAKHSLAVSILSFSVLAQHKFKCLHCSVLCYFVYQEHTHKHLSCENNCTCICALICWHCWNILFILHLAVASYHFILWL